MPFRRFQEGFQGSEEAFRRTFRTSLRVTFLQVQGGFSETDPGNTLHKTDKILHQVLKIIQR